MISGRITPQRVKRHVCLTRRTLAVLLAAATALPTAGVAAAAPKPPAPAPAPSSELVDAAPGTYDPISAMKNPNAAKKCPVRSYRVACVDLDRQLTWVQKRSKVVFGPVPIRSGGEGYATRGGWHRVYWKHKNHWSTLYDQAMPYSQFFDGGQAFHGVYGSIDTDHGSYGCVNLKLADARKLWGVLKKGDRVYVWGRRPGS